MKSKLLLLASILISGCTSTPAVKNSDIGVFVMAGPTNAKASVVSIRWQYGIRFFDNPNSISKIHFSCAPIAGTEFTSEIGDLTILKNGVVIAKGPILPLSKEKTAWLFDNETTNTVCQAKIVRLGEMEQNIQVPVSFSSETKAAAVARFNSAHEINNG